jgi:hypothetical protein
MILSWLEVKRKKPAGVVAGGLQGFFDLGGC